MSESAFEGTYGILKLGTTVVKGDILSSCAVKFDGAGGLVPCNAATDNCVGLVHNATNLDAGYHVDIDNNEYQVFIAEGAIALGDDLTLSTTVPGALRVAAAGEKVVGYAMHAAIDAESCYALIYRNKMTLKA